MGNTVYRVMVHFYGCEHGDRYLSVPYNVTGARHRMSADKCLNDAQKTYNHLKKVWNMTDFSVCACKYVNQRYVSTIWEFAE